MEVRTQMNQLMGRYESSYVEQLLVCLPSFYRQEAGSGNVYERIVAALYRICQLSRKEDDLDEFLREIGVDRKMWSRLETGEERYGCIVKHLERSVEENIRKVNSQIDAYTASSRKGGSCSYNKENSNKDDFAWLKLNNKYPMCEPKLKAKLVQAISDSKNESNIRRRMQDPQHVPRVPLLDQSLVVDEYEKLKIDYRWSEEDERLFLANINSLKVKFNSTEFLKRCGRFRFISEHELQTLAAEEISRKLDQDNKIYLSREFLLDKYYSTTEFLTEPEMRFIIKTSPMLSKCVDKMFIRNALKNIDHADINKLELKIAENIISRFDQVRRAVRESRKLYKQSKNDVIKERIFQFEQKQEFEVAREIAREELRKHKIRPVQIGKSQSAVKLRPFNFASKKGCVPLNQYHPASGLFVKDCNEQCNDDLFNHYETDYIQKERAQGIDRKSPLSSLSMVEFYSGGLETRTPNIPEEAISTICQVIKAHFYQKSMREALDSYEAANLSENTRRTQPSVSGNTSSINKQSSCMDLDRRPKTSCKLPTEESSEAVIKRKILQNKEKAKNIIYVNKMLLSAAENSYASFKALNAKFTSEQINTKDQRGNTALYYASKNQNMEFIGHLLNLGADTSIVGEKQYTPLHFIFKTNNLKLITRCLCTAKTPNLNALNVENKTPLAYATHDVLCKLYLQEGVVVVQNRKVQFDNNVLLTRERLERLGEGSALEGGRLNSRTKLY